MAKASPDLIVVGAGIFGLSVARAARLRGLSVHVLERQRVGAGASGGIVGALTPHAPSRWRAMMSFQFDALMTLSDHIAALQTQTGLDAGYDRSGRATPLVSEKARASAERDAVAAQEVWAGKASFAVQEDVPDHLKAWIKPEAAPFGIATDTVSARVDPRAYLGVLAASLAGSIEEGVEVLSVDSAHASVMTSSGRRDAKAVVLAAGWQVWDLVPSAMQYPEGLPVKGQAALFQADATGLPVIYQDGLYIVPHDNGRIAVGSTSEKKFESPFETDDALDDVIARARAMSPALREAKLVERWAGLRPKPPGREPVVGKLPGHPALWLAAGGFKISFGIAHAIGDAVVAEILGETPKLPVPESFAPSCD